MEHINLELKRICNSYKLDLLLEYNDTQLGQVANAVQQLFVAVDRAL